MKDSFGRTIDYLRLSVTDRCNLRCRYCMPDEGVPSLQHGEVLSYEELLRVAAAAGRLGVRKIRVTGGEPLVRKGIVGFIRQLSELPSRPELTLTTNGLQLAELAGPLKEAGLDRVNVSLDTLREERFVAITRREGLQRVLAGLEAAEAAGLTPLKVNMVPIRGVNADEIVDFARLTLKRGWEVRFIEFMPVAGELDYTPENRFPAQAIMEELSRLGMLLPIHRQGPAGPAKLFRYPEGKGRLGVIPAVSNHFCGDCNRLRVTADGKIRPCLFCSDEIDLRQVLRGSGADAELEELLRFAAGVKPERHHMDDPGFKQEGRKMQGIGG
ncbi:GTP 3',8-cyclase [Desulfuromonas versatilis]|uniref:GTP 3',8-cyclase n=1 Tax=Desulfuromonas versatilis TaxID=2802975 RepID=A0ABM8I177_9BACT|nr:GTP 3',8-cyclase MoaA [Desulfuromonas versatilis]BCR06683.1 GTP 3',8-cyclase [Desulfuromonas versatilis]